MGGRFVSRGFRGRQRESPEVAGRVPPGQYVTSDFPFFRRGRPRTRPSPGGISRSWAQSTAPHHWTWESFAPCQIETSPVDIHCVTKWSKLDTVWEGVRSTRSLTASTPAEYVRHRLRDGGYTTNLPLADVMGGKAWVVFAYGGAPLVPEHGGPARLLVPHLYFWKSAKWVRGLDVTPNATGPDSGSRSAITTTVIHGESSDTRATDLAARQRDGRARRDRRGRSPCA